MKTCTICSNPQRELIERALFKMSKENATLTLKSISEEFDVSVEELQRHALFHTSFDCDPDGETIVRQIKMREADMLAAVTMDQLETIKLVGQRVRSHAQSKDPDDVRFERAVTKAVVDLYVGTGDCLRKNVQTLADINNLLNGSPDEGLAGLANLAAALNASRKNEEADDE